MGKEDGSVSPQGHGSEPSKGAFEDVTYEDLQLEFALASCAEVHDLLVLRLYSFFIDYNTFLCQELNKQEYIEGKDSTSVAKTLIRMGMLLLKTVRIFSMAHFSAGVLVHQLAAYDESCNIAKCMFLVCI